MVWFGRATKRDIDLLTAVIKSAEKNILTKLPTLKDIYFKRLSKKKLILYLRTMITQLMVILIYYQVESAIVILKATNVL